MKKNDFLFLSLLAILFLPFIVSDEMYNLLYHKEYGINTTHVMLTSFLKFAILATLGESLGLRIKSGVYNKAGFGLLPRAVVWGFLGLTIKLSFVIFSAGTPVFLEKTMELKGAINAMKQDFSGTKLWVAFSISTAMNLIFAPVMMTIHKITDTHIIENQGKLNVLFKPIKMKKIITNLDWDTQWNFVFKKTIPFFWIPAHTITFLMPSEFRVLFAAILGIVLGVILSFANQSSRKQNT
ncbi:MAG: hypothetical protein CSA05_02720 [Bacteroidia bacterium]|nr:MAG: hypothetical protein CSA05_02720 [Bacteroidia bacterium]